MLSVWSPGCFSLCKLKSRAATYRDIGRYIYFSYNINVLIQMSYYLDHKNEFVWPLPSGGFQ